MKLVKYTSFGSLTTSLDGVLYVITQEGIQVSDEVASKMKEQFLHNIDVVEIAPIVEPQPPVQDETIVEEKPTKDNSDE